jgi:addiction module HigA family antidote
MTKLHRPVSNGMRPIHPGEILREEFLVPLGMSASALAVALHVPAPRINDVVREKRGVTADTALRLARFFGTSEAFWMGLQDDYDLAVTRKSLNETLATITPLEQMAA